MRLAAARLLWAGLGTADALDALRELLTRRGEGRFRPADGATLVTLDLFMTGRVEIAQWGAGVVCQITANGSSQAVTNPVAFLDKLDDREWLAALSSSPAAPDLAGHCRGAAHPCDARERLALDPPDQAEPLPPIAIAHRVETPRARA